MKRGLILAALHVLIVLSTVALYLSDRARLPSVWTQASPVLPGAGSVHGRYIQLKLYVICKNPAVVPGGWTRCRLSAESGTLAAYADVNGRASITRVGKDWLLDTPLNFFVDDPTRVNTIGSADRISAQVTFVPNENPRPLRLAIQKNLSLRQLRDFEYSFNFHGDVVR